MKEKEEKILDMDIFAELKKIYIKNAQRHLELDYKFEKKAR